MHSSLSPSMDVGEEQEEEEEGRRRRRKRRGWMLRTMAVAAAERSFRAAMWRNQSNYEAKPGYRHTRTGVPPSPSYTHTAKSHKHLPRKGEERNTASLFAIEPPAISTGELFDSVRRLQTHARLRRLHMAKHTLGTCVLTRGPWHCAWRRTSLSADISSSSSSLILCSLSGSSRHDGCNGQTSGRKERKRKTGGK